ncbi:hypothetical protein [Parendozoicomonas sp. Alg238-R29]|uniref:hypothetical protein n=1 Tax=Parendozoicomonas sp. Alg238-R29 TaxID=2993446 RepID=UPI00248DA4E8|nr:hypothetical protein [Parendozoicomonas sp. Alg238-R29]
MTDPMVGLQELQKAIDKNLVEFQKCELSRDLVIHVDQPDGHTRFTYAKIKHQRIRSYAVFVLVEPINGLPCLNIGYAVPEKYQNNGNATEILEKSIAELKNGFARNNVNKFYLEAIVGKDNIISQKIANKLISKTPKECNDEYSNKPALAYTRLIESN